MNENLDASMAIFTTEPGVEQIGMNEIQLTGMGFKFLEWIDAGVALIKLEGGFEALTMAFNETPPIFIRHICPVHISIEIESDISIIDRLEVALTGIISLFDKKESFSVQTRLYGKDERNFKRFDLNQALAVYLTDKGYNLDVRNPKQVLSVVFTTKQVHIGISKASSNLSDWAGGSHRFLREEGLISRAEFKLLEAIDLFKITIPENGKALDLGAAPGGWTKVLRSFNLEVVSVDPAELHPSVKADPGVTHIKQTAEVYFKSNELFDIIVNDMRMDVKESVQIMDLASRCLKPEGIAIMTLKLPKKGMQKITYHAIGMLKNSYKIIGARQLFHNRSEVTVVMKQKEI